MRCSSKGDHLFFIRQFISLIYLVKIPRSYTCFLPQSFNVFADNREQEGLQRMGTTQYKNQVEITDDIHIFFRRTGLLYLTEQVEWLGFRLNNSLGVFNESQAQMLVKFCEQNPEYHIISGTGPGYLENRYVPGHRTYYLAKGDKSPNLVLYIFLNKNMHLFTEEMFDQALAMVPDINRSNQAK